MHKITLEGLDFFAYHGFLPAEREIGNHYRVDISVETDISLACQTDTLDDTVDYSLLYMLVAELMRTPTKLLEHIAHKILTTAFATFPTVQTVEVCVAKQNPPLGGLCHWAKVTLKLDREDAIF